MAKLYNLARMTTASVTTGTITLGSAVSGFLSFANAGITDGDVVSYAISDGSSAEIGTGTYSSTGTTLTRSVLKSTNSNNPITTSGSAQVFITPSAESMGRTLIGKVAASSSVTVGFTTNLSSNYDRFEVDFVNFAPATENTDIHLRTLVGGVVQSSTTFYSWTRTVYFEGATFSSANTSDSKIVLDIGLSTAKSYNATMTFSTPSNSSLKKTFRLTSTYEPSGSTYAMAMSGGVFRGSASSISGIQVGMSTGNIASGTLYLYGISK